MANKTHKDDQDLFRDLDEALRRNQMSLDQQAAMLEDWLNEQFPDDKEEADFLKKWAEEHPEYNGIWGKLRKLLHG